MNTALQVQQTQPETLNKDYLKDEIQTFILGSDLSKKLTSTQKDLCLKTSLAFNLNPLKREVHFVPYHNDIKIVVGYEVYLKRAEKSEKLNGWKVEIDGAGANTKAVVTIHRKDWQQPFTHEVYLAEVRQSTPLWLKMPRFMLKKVAIAQAFRLAFPEDMGGLPYMPEEIGLEVEQTSKEDKLSRPAKLVEPAKAADTSEVKEKSEFTCEKCNKEITRGIKAYSMSKFNKALCMQCQRTYA